MNGVNGQSVLQTVVGAQSQEDGEIVLQLR